MTLVGHTSTGNMGMGVGNDLRLETRDLETQVSKNGGGGEGKNRVTCCMSEKAMCSRDQADTDVFMCRSIFVICEVGNTRDHAMSLPPIRSSHNNF